MTDTLTKVEFMATCALCALSFIALVAIGGFLVDVHVTNLAVYREVSQTPRPAHYTAVAFYTAVFPYTLWEANAMYHEMRVGA